jgi:hypothetical protein
MHFHLEDRHVQVGIQHGFMKLLTNDHAGACPNHTYEFGLEHLVDLLQQRGKLLATSENKAVLVKGCGHNTDPILFQKPCMLERTSRRTVQDSNIYIQIA